MDGKPKPGDTVYVCIPGSGRESERKLHTETVLRVGPIYLRTVSGSIFDLETRISVRGGWRYYLSVDERLDEIEARKWIGLLHRWTDGVSSRRASLETLRQVGALLGLPAPEREEA